MSVRRGNALANLRVRGLRWYEASDVLSVAMEESGPMTPPHTSDVLVYWCWYDKVAAGSALPPSYQQFVELIASSKFLQLLCSSTTYALEWRHALRAHIGMMWEQGRFPLPYDEFTTQICVLDRLVHGMVGPVDQSGTPSKHWDLTTQLLQHFFPHPGGDPWDAPRLKQRVAQWMESTPARERQVLAVVEARLMKLTQHEEFCQTDTKPPRD